MLPGQRGGGRWSSQQQKLALAFAVILLPWLPLVDAQQPAQRVQIINKNPDSNPRHVEHVEYLDDAHLWHASSKDAAYVAPADAADVRLKKRKQHQEPLQAQPQAKAAKRPQRNNNNQNIDDASALATFAPDPSVRAPPSRGYRLSTAPGSGLASPPQSARSLRDWEVEDFVLLATINGDLYATDRKNGNERWRLEVEHPMVETIHYRTNTSVLDADYQAVDHYIWAVEPNNDGGLYIWIPDDDAGLIRTSFTMKSLVEHFAHYADDHLVYTGDKKTTMITLDAATGQVLKWFGSGGSHVNDAKSCIQPNGLYDRNAEECSSVGTITLGRTEYTVGIQRRDGRAIATLRYSEWGTNNFDNDLYHQHHTSMDQHYITSRHDGRVLAYDEGRPQTEGPLFTHQYSTPVARVFDVCRPNDAVADSNPELVALPQPPPPPQDETHAHVRSNSIFLNKTESGSWYAMSGRQYPLILNAPRAQLGHLESRFPWHTLTEAGLSSGLIGTHYLGGRMSSATGQVRPLLPSGSENGQTTIDVGDVDDMDNESNVEMIPDKTASVGDDNRGTPTIIANLKSLPQSAYDSTWAFFTNPIFILMVTLAIFFNGKKMLIAAKKKKPKDLLVEISQDLFNLDFDKKGDKEGKEAVVEEPQVAEPEKPTSQPESIADQKVVDSASPEGVVADAVPPAIAIEDITPEDAPTPKKKKAHRGKRGGVKHGKKKHLREDSQSREETPTSVEEAVQNAKRLGDRPSLEPDVVTVTHDMQGVEGPVMLMGNIEVNMNEQLGTGSNGTLVFAGKFDGRDVAVKRMLIQFYDIASQETRLLRESDDHPNVVRYYSQQIRAGFLYIALEKCAASLADVVEKPHQFRKLADAGKRDLPNVLYQITNGISHLHELRIVHRDLKPQNILVNMGGNEKPRMLVSDFGLCKKLEGGQSSFGATTGRAAGTSGWRAPELLLDDDAREAGVNITEASIQSGSGSVLVNDTGLPNGRRATRAIDIFSLGLVFFYVLTNGSHPFDCGDRYMREVNIRKGEYDLSPLDVLGDIAYEAKDLIESMIQADPKLRPVAKEVMAHPFFWSAKKRLAFLCDVSDHFEKEPRDPPSPALTELERHAPVVTRDFLRKLPREFVDSLGKQRKYTGSKLLDLLRALRNKRNHYEDMPQSLKDMVGPLPHGYLAFWTVKFPELLLICWNVVYNMQWEGTDRFAEYYKPADL